MIRATATMTVNYQTRIPGEVNCIPLI
jgi:hypothetical protein